MKSIPFDPRPEPDGWLSIELLNDLPGITRQVLFKEMTHWTHRGPGPDSEGTGSYPTGLILYFTPEAAEKRRCDRLHIPWTSVKTMAVKGNSKEAQEALNLWNKLYGDDF